MLSKSALMDYLLLVTSCDSYALHSAYNTLFARLPRVCAKGVSCVEARSRYGAYVRFGDTRSCGFQYIYLRRTKFPKSPTSHFVSNEGEWTPVYTMEMTIHKQDYN